MKSSDVSPALGPTIVAKQPSGSLYWLALGTFAVGTEGFMIAALLPTIAADLSVKVATAGQLVTIFALAYAVSSPILTAALGGVDRRRLLIFSLAAFAVANLVAASVHSFWTLAGARILLALAAGLYVPGANALASALVTPERRGRALAIVNGGITIAIALGVPIGALVGERLGWRMTFVGVAALSALATVALKLRLPVHIGAGLHTATLRERLVVVRQPVVAHALATTTLWAIGAYTVYTYLAPFLRSATVVSAPQISLVLLVWGISAAVGVALGGSFSDRHGPAAVQIPALVVLAFAFSTLSISAHFLSPAMATLPVCIAVVLWGISAWSFYPPQQARLISAIGLKAAPIALSLNASFMYLGFSLGAAIGSVTLALSGTANLGYVGALFELGSLLLIRVLTSLKLPGELIPPAGQVHARPAESLPPR
ncbi:MFS transporter [Paraburkholderia aspalathi]